MVIVKPNVPVDNIQLNIGPNNAQTADLFMNDYGNFHPLLEINKQIINPADILQFSYSVNKNSIPTFFIKIKDEKQEIQNELTDSSLVTGVLFIGNKFWYHKNNLFVTKVTRLPTSIVLTGIFYNEKLYETNQESYRDKSLKDIFTDVCTKTGLGFVSEDTPLINKIHKYLINGNKKYIDMIPSFVSTFTYDGIWCIDEYYVFHLQNFDTLSKKEVDTYSVLFDRELDEPKPIVITNYLNKDNDIEEYQEKDLFKHYGNISIDNNLGTSYLTIPKNISLTEHSVDSYEDVGTGSIVGNTFSRFKQNLTPFHSQVLQKDLTGNIYEVELERPIIELFPFAVVELEVWRKFFNKETERFEMEINKYQSGKKIVIGYEFHYNSGFNNKLKQKIKLI